MVPHSEYTVTSRKLSTPVTPNTVIGAPICVDRLTLLMANTNDERAHALGEYKTKLLESREWEAKLKSLRLEIKDLNSSYEQSEDAIKALQSVGQIIGEVLKQLDEERCTL